MRAPSLSVSHQKKKPAEKRKIEFITIRVAAKTICYPIGLVRIYNYQLSFSKISFQRKKAQFLLFFFSSETCTDINNRAGRILESLVEYFNLVHIPRASPIVLTTSQNERKEVKIAGHGKRFHRVFFFRGFFVSLV